MVSVFGWLTAWLLVQSVKNSALVEDSSLTLFEFWLQTGQSSTIAIDLDGKVHMLTLRILAQ